MADFNYQLLNDDASAEFLYESRDSHKRVQNLDKFLTKVYDYFLGKGFFNILLAKLFNLLSLLWVIVFTTFLLTSVDFKNLFDNVNERSVNINQIIVYSGLDALDVICLFIFGIFWLYKFLQFMVELKDNWEIRTFFHQELQVPEEELNTIEWSEVVNRIIKVPRLCILKEQMTPLDIANRIMRKDNYLIAMINKDILHLYIPLPGFRNRNIVTKTIEWGLSYTIFNYIFDQNNCINKQVLDPAKHYEKAQELKHRFKLMGVISLIFSPFIFVFLLIYFAFQYGEQLHNNPTSFASRQWSPLARWKFRELNELPHVFQKRLIQSYKKANKYVNSFPMNSVAIVARFFSFIVGSIIAVLLFLSVYNENALFNLELFEGRSAVWFLGVGGSFVAACRAVIPPENAIMEPDKTMEELVQFTHYLPSSWRGKTHTGRVLSEFSLLFDYKIFIFFTELVSVLFAPFILIFSLPNSADKVIEFFRVFTVHEPGVGDICKFATFQLEEHGNKKYGVLDTKSNNKKMRTKQGKLEKSFLNFKANHPEWKPNKPGSKYIDNLAYHVNHSGTNEANGTQFSSSTYNLHSDFDEGASNSGLFTQSDSVRSYLSSPEKSSVQDSIASLNKIHRMFYKTTFAQDQPLHKSN